MIKSVCTPNQKGPGNESTTRDIIAVLAGHSRVAFPLVERRPGGADRKAATTGHDIGIGAVGRVLLSAKGKATLECSANTAIMSLVIDSFPDPFWFGVQTDFNTRKDRDPSFPGFSASKSSSMASFARGSPVETIIHI